MNIARIALSKSVNTTPFTKYAMNITAKGMKHHWEM